MTRKRLPNRRGSESFAFALDGLGFTATVSRFADGRIGELFLNNHKAGNQADTKCPRCSDPTVARSSTRCRPRGHPACAMPRQPRPRARSDRCRARSAGRHGARPMKRRRKLPLGWRRKPLRDCPICRGKGTIRINLYGPCGGKENTGPPDTRSRRTDWRRGASGRQGA
jgi:hypothetical protein